MAKFLEFDKKEKNFNGVIPLRKGDQWELEALILDSLGSERLPVNLTDKGVTGFFPAATGGVAVPAMIDSPLEGSIKFTVPPEITTNLKTVNQSSMYVEISDEGVIDIVETVETRFEPLEILERGFRNF